MQTQKHLTDYFDRIRIVSLPSRQDRRYEFNKQLEKIGLMVGEDGVEFFDAIRPLDAGGFPNIGARGCFHSHLQLLKEAVASNSQHLLILEDDVNFIDSFSHDLPEIITRLEEWQWDICYLGHTLAVKSEKPYAFSYCSEPIMTSHAYAVKGQALPALIAYLESVVLRSPGDPDGGPMHYDGALSMFRAQNPQIKTLIVSPAVMYQRPSRTDIHDLAFYDRLPGVRQLANWARKNKARLMFK